MGHQGGLRTHPRGRARGLAASVAATDNDDIEGVRLGIHAATSIPESKSAEAGNPQSRTAAGVSNQKYRKQPHAK
jgi:hypothetical protein